MEAKPKPGQRVLVFAAAGGVGHVAVQLAKSLELYTVGVTGPSNTVRQAAKRTYVCNHAWLQPVVPAPVLLSRRAC
jgi:NADPH:quinone reductase-like Zn-dependent oxidoreductase